MVANEASPTPPETEVVMLSEKPRVDPVVVLESETGMEPAKAKEISYTPPEVEAVMLGVGGEKSSVRKDLGPATGQVPSISSRGKLVLEEPMFEGAGGQGDVPRLEIGYGSSG